MRAPKAGSAENKIMGKVGASPFKSLPSQGKTSDGSSNAVLYAGLVLFGAAAIMLMRARSGPPVQTGPLAVLTQSAAPDQSTIDNLTESVLAVAGHVYVWGPKPTGGASTPLTPANVSDGE